MSLSMRREREREALRQTILDAAREILEMEGYEKVSMRRIAGRIDYSATAIYLHFKDREALMDALAAEGYARLADAFVPVASENPTERLRRIGDAYIKFALANRHWYTLMFHVGSSLEERYGEHDTRRASATRAFALLEDAVRQIEEAEDAPFLKEPEAVTLTASVFWAHIHGAVSLLVTGHGRPFAKMQPQFCRQVVETAIAGLLAEMTSTHAGTMLDADNNRAIH